MFDDERKNEQSPEELQTSCFRPGECTKTGYGFADVSIPIELEPDANVGKIETECCGEPEIVCECIPCNTGCSIFLTQRIKIKIPLCIGITTKVGESSLKCYNCHEGAD